MILQQCYKVLKFQKDTPSNDLSCAEGKAGCGKDFMSFYLKFHS
jgi:hypothetical protein